MYVSAVDIVHLHCRNKRLRLSLQSGIIYIPYRTQNSPQDSLMPRKNRVHLLFTKWKCSCMSCVIKSPSFYLQTRFSYSKILSLEEVVFIALHWFYSWGKKIGEWILHFQECFSKLELTQLMQWLSNSTYLNKLSIQCFIAKTNLW